MIAWGLLLFSAIFSVSAHAYFGPTVESDEISTSMQAGPGFFLQTVSATDHFAARPGTKGYLISDEDLSAIAANERRPVGEENVKDREIRDELLNLSWMVGYAYYRSSADDPVSGALIYDEAHAIKLGLAWEASGVFDLTAAGTYQVVPAENYSQGIYDVSAGYTIPLISEKEPHVAGSPQDADVYYQNQELASEVVHTPAVRRFPNIRIGLLTELQIHTKSPTTSGRNAGTALTSDQTLNVSASGPELVYNVNRRLKFRLAAMFYLYDSAPNSFLANTTIGGFRTKTDLAVSDFEGTTGLLLLFPNRTYSGTGTLWFNRAVNFNLIMEGATYNATGSIGAGLLTYTVSTGVVSDWAFAPRWKVGAALDFTIANQDTSATTGGLKLGFAL